VTLTFPLQPNHVIAAADAHEIIEKLLETMFSIIFMPILYKENVLNILEENKFFYAKERNSGKCASRFRPCPNIIHPIYIYINKSDVYGHMTFILPCLWTMPVFMRQTWTSCSLKTATQPHCSEFVMWALEHKDKWTENSGRCSPPEIPVPAEKSNTRYWKSWQVHTSLWIVHVFQNSFRVWLHAV
jgi:hypothetical protein